MVTTTTVLLFSILWSSSPYESIGVHGFGLPVQCSTPRVGRIMPGRKPPPSVVSPSRVLLLSSSPTKIPGQRAACTSLGGKVSGNNDEEEATSGWWKTSLQIITENPQRSILFSFCVSTCGAILGPFLDSYHSAFGVLRYNEPISLVLWGTPEFPALTTAWWVPELFGVAGFLIGWLYILLDPAAVPEDENDGSRSFLSTSKYFPSPPKILLGISLFTFQYWWSGILVQEHVDRTTILNLMSVVAAVGFWLLDGTRAGLITSAMTAIGGPLMEVALISCTIQGILPGGYHYTDLGETGFFPLWIVPVYFLGGPANGNLARGFWNVLSGVSSSTNNDDCTSAATNEEPCSVCLDTRQVPCPNCDGVGAYVATGRRTTTCTSCRGRGCVICRACFNRYDEDPYDIDAIREKMSRMPD